MYLQAIQDLLTAYQKLYKEWKILLQQKAGLQTAEPLAPEMREFLQNEITLIESLELSEEFIRSLENEFNALSSKEEQVQLLIQLRDTLEGSSGASTLLTHAYKTAQSLATFNYKAQATCERIESLSIDLKDIVDECTSLWGELKEFSQTAEDSLHEKINLWNTLKRKYGNSVSVIRDQLKTLKQKLHKDMHLQTDLKMLTEHIQQKEKKSSSTS